MEYVTGETSGYWYCGKVTQTVASDDMSGSGLEVAGMAIIHTLQVLERIHTRDESADKITNSAS